MVIVVGGAYQGKLDFALRQYDLTLDDVADGEDMSLWEIPQKKIINHFHLLIRRMLIQGQLSSDAKDCMTDDHRLTERLDSYIKQLINQYQEGIIICDEVGCGLVPMDAFDRYYRDMVGRCMCRLTPEATEVIRITCGISRQIKSSK